MKNLKKAFSRIYDQYVDKIYRFIFFKVSSQEIAEDLCSETFIRGWQSFKENNKEIKNPQAFLYKIARNLIIDYYREKSKVQFVSADCVSIDDPETNLEKQSLDRSDIETIRTAIADLKDDYREIIILHYINDLSIPEVAEIMGKTEGAVRVQLHRALKSLRNRIEQA